MHTFGWKQVFLQIIFFVIFFTTLKDADVLQLTTRIKRPNTCLLLFTRLSSLFFFYFFFYYSLDGTYYFYKEFIDIFRPYTGHCSSEYLHLLRMLLELFENWWVLVMQGGGFLCFRWQLFDLSSNEKVHLCMYSKFVVKLLQICVTCFCIYLDSFQI